MSGTNSSTSPNQGNYVDFDEFVDFHLNKARSSIKVTEISTVLVAVAAGVLSYLLLFVVFDQWVLKEGFSDSARLLLFGGMMLTVLLVLGIRVAYPLLKRIHPLYAARMLEQAEPTLKSNLLNLVDARETSRGGEPVVLRAMEKRAAVELQRVDVEQAVDRRRLLHASYFLMALVLACCLYAVFSPKDLFTSMRRALFPTSVAAVPTQTVISDVTPGETTVQARSLLTVEADIRQRIPPQVTLYYTTADHKFVDQPVEMRRIEDNGFRFRGMILGENGRGLLQDIVYRIEAGDARTQNYAVTVVQPPSAKVERVKYVYPRYTQLSEKIEAGGNIDAWEGTTVTVSAIANTPVRSATLRLSDTESNQKTGEEFAMKVRDGIHLEVEWKLAFRTDGTSPRFYHIHINTAKNEIDTNPTQHSVRIRPDQPPEVALLSPRGDLEMPANGVIPLLIQATDPDFQLRYLTLRADRIGTNGDSAELVNQTLFDGQILGQSFRGNYDFALQPHNLKPGDKFQFWIEAKDNRQPTANRKATPRLNVSIIDPISADKVKDQLAEEKRKQEELVASSEGARNEERPQDPMPRDETPAEPNPQESKKNEQSKNGQETPPAGNEPDKPRDGDEKSRSQRDTPATDNEALDDLLRKAMNQLQKEQPESKQGKQQDAEKAAPKSNERKDHQQRDGNQQNQQNAQDNASDRTQQQQEQTNDNQKSKQDENRNDSKNNTQNQQQQQKPSETNKTGSKSGDGPQKTGKQTDTGRENQKSTDPRQSQDRGKPSEAKPQSSPDPKQDGRNDPSKEKPNPDKPGTNSQNNPQPNKPSPGEQPKSDSTKPETPNQQPNQGTKPQDSAPKQNPESKDGKDLTPKPGTDQNPKNKDPKPNPEQGKDNDTQPGPGRDSKDPTTPKDGTDPKPSSPEGSGEKAGAKPPTTGSDKPDPNGTGQDPSPSDSPGSRGKNNDPAKNAQGVGKDPGKDTGTKPPSRNPNPGQGEETPAPESPDAIKEKARGDEEGPATGDKNPTGDEPNARGKLDKVPGSDQGAKSPRKSKDPPSPELARGDNPAGAKSSTPKTGEKEMPDPKTTPSDSGKTGNEAKNTKGAGETPSKPGTEKPGSEKNEQPRGKGTPPPEGAGSKPPESEDKQSEGSGASPGDKPSKSEGKGQSGKGESGSGGKPSDSPSSDSSRGKGGEGKPGKAEGKGSSPSPSSKQPGGKSGDGGGEGIGDESSANPNPGTATGGRGNRAGDGSSSDDSSSAAADAANLDFARKASNLVLKRLQEELKRGEVDEELLKQLGWTKERMKQFVQNLEKTLKDTGDDNSPEAVARRLQFEETLKNQVLSSQTKSRRGERKTERRTMQTGGRTVTVPPEYREQFEAYSRSLSRQLNGK